VHASFVDDRLGAEADRADAALERAADLYLACACLTGAAGAIAAFEREHRGDIDAALVRLALPPDLRDEVRQRLREKLFVADGERPRIARYHARGSLRAWVRAVAVRIAIDLLREQRSDEVPTEAAVLESLAHTDDVGPELTAMCDRYRGQVTDAFTAALAALSPRQRNILRQYFVHGLTIDHLGAMYQVHRVTAFRWLTAAKTDLLAAARRELERTLGTATLDGDDLLRMLRSQIDISLDRLLRTEPA
jgi:RNA polymerase sigma-70 factor, ECF subfamily